MTEMLRAVFLSYASQDAAAARRISDTLRAAGIEVWFDQSELRGGDVWDRQIRKQIHECALVIPIISENTQARPEGYFRLEWNLAVERTHSMSERMAFLVPVVIDDTRDAEADVPQKFREVQWTRLPGGETPAAFVERVARLLAPGSAASGDDERASEPPRPAGGTLRRRAGPKALLAAIALAALAIGYFGFDRARHPAAPSAVPEKSIAVLPFVNMTSDKEQEYFSDGLSEEMIDLLSQIPDLRVPARTSSFSFKGKSADIPSIAQKLHVAHVLEGSVRKSGDTIRVTVQLIRADSGYHLWSKTFDRDFKDIFKVQDEIAAAVVEALKVKLGPVPPVAAHRSTNTEAYNQFLLGRHFAERQNPDGWRRAVEAYHQAIALDPDYAAAYARLAVSEAFFADQAGDAAGLKQAQADAEKAIALAPEEAEGYGVRGLLRSTWDWDWAGAQADFAKALDHDPSSAAVQGNYADLLGSLGRLAQAIEVEKKAIELDPLSPVHWNNLGQYLTANRDYPAAGEALSRALQIQPDSTVAMDSLATLQLLQGHAGQALATFRKVDVEVLRLQGISMAEHSLKASKESRQALDEMIAKSAQGWAYQIAQVFAWRGEKDPAFEWLERGYRQRDGGLASVKADPLLESLHGDPRFAALLEKMNLSE